MLQFLLEGRVERRNHKAEIKKFLSINRSIVSVDALSAQRNSY
jgi:hypothetical protein